MVLHSELFSALWKWMKFINNGLFHPRYCSLVFLNGNLWSVWFQLLCQISPARFCRRPLMDRTAMRCLITCSSLEDCRGFIVCHIITLTLFSLCIQIHFTKSNTILEKLLWGGEGWRPPLPVTTKTCRSEPGVSVLRQWTLPSTNSTLTHRHTVHVNHKSAFVLGEDELL